MFGKKEEYSKEAYDHAAEEAKKASEQFSNLAKDRHEHRYDDERSGFTIPNFDAKYAFSVVEARAEKAKKKLEELASKGEVEARSLDAKYTELKNNFVHALNESGATGDPSKVTRALDELSQFEEEKLGMHKEEAGEQK